MVKVSEVESDSIAEEVGLKPGDEIIAINNKPIRDYIDFQYKTADKSFVLNVKKKDNNYWDIEIERSYQEKLGIKFDKIIFDKLKRCNNKCIFCFVDQLPEGMRESLTIKDDDYRFSFLQGSFITLTNIDEDELSRIIEMRLSPLNISVHTTNPQLRIDMMHNPAAGRIIKQLRKLTQGGIRFNTQVVLCPGINDGAELDKTINDLSNFYPSLISLGIVPVGITKFRNNNIIKKYDCKKADRLLQQIKEWQQRLVKRFGENWLYAADEFYLLAGKEIPSYEEYNGFPQLENGIGLTRILWKKFSDLQPCIPKTISQRKFGIITSQMGKLALKPILKKLNNISGLSIKLIPVINNFLGKSVTVTGLLTATDIIKTINQLKFRDTIILPGIAVNNCGYFLDQQTLDDIKRETSRQNIFVCSNLEEMVEVITDGQSDCSNSRPS